MFRQLARLAEEHELLEALPFLRGNADDEDDLIQDAIAALPPLVARFFFAPRGGPKAPPLLGRCFTLKKLSAPHDVREACLRGAANSFRFRAELVISTPVLNRNVWHSSASLGRHASPPPPAELP